MNGMQLNEVFALVTDAAGRGQLVEEMKRFANRPDVKAICQLNFSNVDWGVGEGWPEGYKGDACPEGLQELTISGEARRINTVFGRPDITPKRKTELLIDMLEGMHHAEAEIVIFAKDHALQELYPAISEQLCKDAGIL